MDDTFAFAPIEIGSQAFLDADNINQEAFPENERIPLEKLAAMERVFPGSRLIAVYEEELCVSFFHIVELPTFVYAAFFAVSAEKRGMGYGTKILKCILDSCNGKPLMGDVEYPSEDAENYEQRIKRIRFYERNGVYNTGKIIESEQYGKYYVISSEKEAPFEDYRTFVKLYYQAVNDDTIA